MRQPLALALAMIFLPAAACAQRGGSRGGGFSLPHASFSSHSAPAFRGNFTAAAPYRPSTGRLTSGRPLGASLPFRSPSGAATAFRVSPASARPPFYTRNRIPHPPRYPYGYGAGIVYAYPLWLGPTYFDDSADEPDDPSGASVPPADTDTYAGLDPGQFQPPLADEIPQPSPEPAPEAPDAVTLIFKDGRPAQQVHNYALTRTTLYVIGSHHRDIPVADLDLAATEKANRQAGVAFELPGSPQ